MHYFKRRRPHHRPHRQGPPPEPLPQADVMEEQQGTGSEAPYMKSLVDSRTTVTVVLTTGEELRGRIRYYDRECFSVGPADGGPKIFLRKSSVVCIREE
jgi:small nuclear ribonucleoprotein (snRNP)-like protein